MHNGLSRKKGILPLDAQRLRDLAMRYVGRYAVSERKLADYLERKLRQRGWQDESPADPQALAREFSAKGYVDDKAIAGARAREALRKGHGVRRLAETLTAAGIDADNRLEAMEEAQSYAWQAADNFARRRKIGPYATQSADAAQRRRQLAAFARAGHDYEVARRFVDAAPGDILGQ